jgi:hypothetical protein
MASNYDYDYCGFGMTLYFPQTEETVWIQGHEADELMDELENCDSQEMIDVIISQYEVLLED